MSQFENDMSADELMVFMALKSHGAPMTKEQLAAATGFSVKTADVIAGRLNHRGWGVYLYLRGSGGYTV